MRAWLTRTRFTMAPNLSLPRIAEGLPFTYTGADFYALCSDAMLKAVTRQASAVDAKIAVLNAPARARSASASASSAASDTSQALAGREPPRNRPDTITTAYFFDHYATAADVAVQVSEADFVAAQRELVPSVSAKELEHYRRVREQFEGVAEKKGGEGEGMVVANGVPGAEVARRGRVNGRPRSSGRGKGKGKGKMREGDGEGEEEDEVDDVAPVLGGFQAGSAADDEDLY